MAGSMESPLAKHRRAEQHYLMLQNEIAPNGDDFQECPVRVECKRDGLEHLFRSLVGNDVGDDWPLIIGDIYFNLRSALDHLVYQLHVRRYRGRVPADAEEESMFPILDQPRGAAYPWKQIRRLSLKQQTSIKHLQPYVGRRDDLEMLRRGLSVINDINRIDKHRKPHVAWHGVGLAISPGFAPEFGFKSDPFFGVPLKTDAVVQRWTFTKAPPNVDMYPRYFKQVIMDEPTSGYTPLLALLRTSIKQTKTVLDRFEKYLA